jgi:hypothetical protein
MSHCTHLARPMSHFSKKDRMSHIVLMSHCSKLDKMSHCSGLWKLEGPGGSWKALEEAGRPWRKLEGPGGSWKALEEAGRSHLWWLCEISYCDNASLHLQCDNLSFDILACDILLKCDISYYDKVSSHRFYSLPVGI